jgi:hypothetical protein
MDRSRRGRDRASLEAAIAEFMAARSTTAETARSYRAVLRRLQAAYPGYALKAFDPPAGTTFVRDLLDKAWGHKAPETYRSRLSMLHTFFEWHCKAGNMTGDPTGGLTYPDIERESRRTITRAEAEKILKANPDPRDEVPLRLLLTLGVQKDTLQELRFRHLDAARRTVTFEWRGESQASAVEDDDFWIAVEALRAVRRATPEHYVLCAQISRAHRATAPEFAAMERDGALDGGRAYLWQKPNGRWYRAKLTPTLPRGAHGVHDWWYRCVERAGLVPAGAVSGFSMLTARYTVGRRRWTSTGSRTDLARHMGGLRSRSSATNVYGNRDADSLDTAIRRVRRRLRLRTYEQLPTAMGIDGKRPPSRWWKEPLLVFAEYVDDERDLIELSRVSVEMLRLQDAKSVQLHDAAETLTRAVTAADLVIRAQGESATDHPLLHGHSLVAIWSAMETMIGDLVQAWLLWWPPARTRAASIVSVSQPQGLPPDEWAAGVHQALGRSYQKLNQKVRSPRRLDQYEWLLDAVGLVATAQENDVQMVQNLWEMQQIRNVFAHKRGVADARLVANCGHLPFKIGDEIRIDRDAWADFLVTAMVYADLIVRRMKRKLRLPDWMRTSPARAIRYPGLSEA